MPNVDRHSANGAGSSGYEPGLLGTIPNMNHTISVQGKKLGELLAIERTHSEGLIAKPPLVQEQRNS